MLLPGFPQHPAGPAPPCGPGPAGSHQGDGRAGLHPWQGAGQQGQLASTKSPGHWHLHGGEAGLRAGQSKGQGP